MSKDCKMSVFELLGQIKDEDEATVFLEKCRWGGTPRCASTNVTRTPATAPMPWRCRPCRKYYSVRTNTVMAQT